MLNIILLSGGSGSRLWPLSNDARSKQFLKVLRDAEGNHQSMVQRTFERIGEQGFNANVTIATCQSQIDSIERQVEGEYSVVVEPERRDTAPAIMLACAKLAFADKVDLDSTVIVMPIDTYAGAEYYEGLKKIDSAVRAGVGKIVLLGVEPTYPSNKYGYIIPSVEKGECRPVSYFTEKPTEELAARLIDQGALWNCGVFGFKLSYLIDIISSYTSLKDFDSIRDNYSMLPKNSFDYEIVEKAASVAVVSFSGDWKDLGTWNTLSEVMLEESSGRVVCDKQTCDNVHVINETGLPLVVSGIKDAVIIATPDGILVSDKLRSAHLKPLVAAASLSRPMYEQRRWGEYRVIDANVYPDGKKSLSKELAIRPGKQLSYQLHNHRSEVWTIVSGVGEVVLNGVVKPIKAGSVIEIESGVKHAARAFQTLHIIEVQQGDVLIEEDIDRFGNFWN
ncbi:sugar phosphate nucleotidyltransferase [Adlercreutzia sp. ZJ141]|uniref:sugar phosphate nucleotidyltransferase n=1 Tax=Adlercreutzia sp. ZJ141 TaxID=2709406 RepID=UPI0013EDD53A|nr:sugar phosphate nucleotidyltransferase [Adlercreutzia sp. ZJ141]